MGVYGPEGHPRPFRVGSGYRQAALPNTSTAPIAIKNIQKALTAIIPT